jgi:DNA-binding transcriptional MocR family regulator
MDYIFPPGEYELRRQIAARSIRWLGALRAQDVLISSGGMDALNLTLRAVTRPGDTVAIESPTFFGLLQALENLGLRAVEIPTCPREGLDVEALEQVARKQKISAALLIPSFSNPLGALMPEDARKRLVDLAQQRNFVIVEDDIYGELHYSQRRLPPIKAFDSDGRVILISSFSKTVLPGLRIGWIATERYIRRLEELQFNSTICAPTLQQYAMARFIESGAFDAHLRRLRRTISASMDRFSAAICEHFPPATRMTRPQGGFVQWIELPRNVDAVMLFRHALHAGISIAPGPIFSTQEHYNHCIRLNCGHPWSERIESAIATLGGLIKKLAR